MPISKDAVEARLHPERWPAKLSRDGLNGEADFSRAIGHAQGLFSEFEAFLAHVAQDKRLTAAGRREKLEEFAAKRAPALAKHLPTIAERVEEVPRGRQRWMDETQAKPAKEPHDIALMQEIRTWLRSLPPGDRAEAVRKASMSGDGSALRAVLTAPAYLTGCDPVLITAVREHLFDVGNPGRAQTLQHLEQAGQLAKIAVEGVVEYMGEVIARQVEPAQIAPAGVMPTHPQRIPT